MQLSRRAHEGTGTQEYGNLYSWMQSSGTPLPAGMLISDGGVMSMVQMAAKYSMLQPCVSLGAQCNISKLADLNESRCM